MENKNIVDKRGGRKQKIIKLIKNNKIQIVFAALIIFVFALTYISYVNKTDKTEKVTLSDGTRLTEQVQNILKDIKGVGDVKVLIVYDGGEQIEIASKIDRRVDKVEDDGRVTEVVDETITPIMTDDDKPLVIGTKRANIDGVVVVADGGDSQAVRVAIMQALSTLLKIDYNCIKVFDKE